MVTKIDTSNLQLVVEDEIIHLLYDDVKDRYELCCKHRGCIKYFWFKQYEMKQFLVNKSDVDYQI